jgi:hypothetical protein
VGFISIYFELFSGFGFVGIFGGLLRFKSSIEIDAKSSGFSLFTIIISSDGSKFSSFVISTITLILSGPFSFLIKSPDSF